MAAELLLSGWREIPVLRCFRRQQEVLRRASQAPAGDPFALQIAETSAQLGIPCSEVTRIVDEWMVLRPGRWLKRFARQELLYSIAEFRRTGGQTAVVSDYPARTKLHAMKIAQLFDVVIACGESAGDLKLKPDPSSLLLAAERLGAAIDMCLVIGDRWDVDGEAARRAGMKFFHVSSLPVDSVP